jgi:hypothetical protein
MHCAGVNVSIARTRTGGGVRPARAGCDRPIRRTRRGRETKRVAGKFVPPAPIARPSSCRRWCRLPYCLPMHDLQVSIACPVALTARIIGAAGAGGIIGGGFICSEPTTPLPVPTFQPGAIDGNECNPNMAATLGGPRLNDFQYSRLVAPPANRPSPAFPSLPMWAAQRVNHKPVSVNLRCGPRRTEDPERASRTPAPII